jgi:chitodextrinase
VAKGSANSSAAHNYALEVTSGNRVECGIGNGSSANVVQSSATLASGTLYHLACVWTGTQLQVYVNGVASGTAVQTLTPLGNPAPLTIGQYGGSADPTNGLIDEVRVSSAARTQAQVQSDMNGPISVQSTDTTKPTVAITAPSAGAVVSGSVSATADATDNVGVAGVQFTLDGSNLGAEDTAAPYTVLWDTRSSANGSRSISAVARDAAGNRQTASSVTVSVSNDTSAPTVPTNLTATAASSSQINLSWSAATDNVGVAGYRVTRNGSVITSTTTTTYSDTGLAPQTAYTYSVAAFDAAGNTSAGSAPANATTQAGPPPPPPPPPSGGLVAAYRFGEGVGTATADGSTNGNGGTLVNGPSWITAGKYGNAINFDGVNDYVRVADSASLDLGRTGTVEAWVKLDTLNRWHGVVAKGSSNTNSSHNYALELSNSNRWLCILGNGASAVLVQSPSGPVANRYYHVACAWDGSTARLYVDGMLSGSSTQLVTPAGNAAQVSIGQFGGDTDRLDGVIDEVRIYGRALSQAEVQSDMNTPIP